MSIRITLNSSTLRDVAPENFTVDFPNAIPVEKSYEVALIQANIWYSWFNIASYFNNNLLRIFNGREWIDLQIEDGIYQIDQLNQFIKRSLAVIKQDPNSINLVPNFSTLKLIIELKEGCQLDLTQGNLHKLLGFKSKIVNATEQGHTFVDITRGITAIYLHCDLVRASYENSVASDVLYSFNPSSPTGSLIQINPVNPVYLPVNRSGQINYITMKLTDQANNPINLNGEHVNYVLHLRPESS